MIHEGYKIELKGWYGDYEDCVAVFTITHPNGKVVEDSRFGCATKKGFMRTSIYGVKIKVDLVSGKVQLA
jgi:hypothetical protein